MNELGRRLREVPLAEAVAASAVGMIGFGVAIAVDGLVTAAQAQPGAGSLDWPRRLALGLWEFRIEHTLWFTVGLLALWWALDHGALLGGWSQPASKLAGGLAVGFAVVAVAIVAGSTYVALAGEVGAVASFGGRERLFTWLLQVLTAAGAGVLWAFLAARLPAGATTGPDPIVANLSVHDSTLQQGGLTPLLHDQPLTPEPPAPVPIARAAPEPPPPSPPPPRTATGRAQRIYQERLAYSPRREEARRLLERIAEAEREGRGDDAAALTDQLASL